MKTLTYLVSKLFYFLVLLAGLTFIGLWVWHKRLELPRVGAYGTLEVNTMLLLLAPGVLLSILALVKLASQGGARGKVRSISYPGTYGNVVILLDSVEANLNRVIGKLREVKWISVTVIPDEEHCKARVEADVKLLKGVGESARMTANRVSDRLAETAANLLGVDDVTRVDLTVRGIGVYGDLPEPAPSRAAKPVEERRPAEPAPAPEPTGVTPEVGSSESHESAVFQGAVDESLPPLEVGLDEGGDVAEGAEGELEGEAETEAEEAGEEDETPEEERHT